MPIGDVIADTLGSMMRRFGRIDANQKQAYTLIRACRKLQKNYCNLKDPQKLFAILKKVDEKLETFATRKKDDARTMRPTAHDFLTREDFESLYEPSEAKTEWNSFSQEAEDAEKYDQCRQLKLISLKRRKSDEWPSDKTNSVDIVITFPKDFTSSSPSELIHLEHLKLDQNSTFEEVIWLFSRRQPTPISLQENIQFYHKIDVESSGTLDPATRPFPAISKEYFALRDRSVRILLDIGKPRIYGNMCKLKVNGPIIFKEFNGTLMGSEKIRQDVSTNNFRIGSGTGRAVNWESVLDSALKELKSPAASSHKDGGSFYRIQSADPEPSAPSFPQPSTFSFDRTTEDATDQRSDLDQGLVILTTSNITHSSPSNVAVNMPAPYTPAGHRGHEQAATGQNNAPAALKNQPATTVHQSATAHADISLRAHVVVTPSAPSSTTSANLRTVPIPAPISFPQPNTTAMPNVRATEIPTPKLLPVTAPHQPAGTSTSRVAAAAKAWGAAPPQNPPANVPPPPPKKRGFVRRLVDYFTQ